MRRIQMLCIGICIALAGTACGGGGSGKGGGFGKKGRKPKGKKSGMASSAMGAPSARAIATGDDDDDDDDSSAAAPAPAASAGPQGNLTKGFTRWRPNELFLGEKVYAAKVIGNSDVIVLTDDNHVGVSKDKGKTWHYQRMPYGSSASFGVHGKVGGPYYVVGKEGYVAWSPKGYEWSELPRVTDSKLDDVAVTDDIMVAIKKNGRTIVTYGVDGKTFKVFELPKGKWLSRVHSLNGKVWVETRREVWASNDKGTTWYPEVKHPRLPSRKYALTSQGVCRTGLVDKRYGMVCKVKGEAWAVSDNDILTVDGDEVQISADGGKTWTFTKLPFRGIRAIGGWVGGPYIAVANGGNLATTDGKSDWKQIPQESRAQLNAVHVSGNKALVVGSGGAVILSTDKGTNWRSVDSGAKARFTHVVDKGGKLILPAGKKVYVSSDGGASWAEAEDKEALGELPKAPGRLAKCEERKMPAVGAPCKLDHRVMTPGKLPTVGGFNFNGDFGVAWGIQGLVAVTSNGGATWRWTWGYRFTGSIQDMVVKGQRIVIVAKKMVMVSTNGGTAWRKAVLPKRHGNLNAAFIDSNGSAWVVGDNNTVLKATGTLSTFFEQVTTAGRYTSFFKVLEVGGVLYFSGKWSKFGKLWRTADQGKTWKQIYTGQSHMVVNMVAKGSRVLAVTSPYAGHYYQRKSGDAVLLLSIDGGLHFAVKGYLPHSGSAADLQFDGASQVVVNNLITNDMGRTWTRYKKDYRRGLEAVGDGTNRKIDNRRYHSKRDLFYVVGKDIKKWVVIESFYHEDALITCDAKGGCWMACGSVVYRPF